MKLLRFGGSPQPWTAVVCVATVVTVLTTVACGVYTVPPVGTAPLQVLPGQASGVFTPAHSTFRDAVNDFFMVKGEPKQPLDFPHYRHVEVGKNGPELKCTEACHEGVTRGPMAGLPSINTCMGCHSSIATDKPRIQQITKWADQGLDISWVRVYGYTQPSHVKFNHAPHIRANVECATCHGDIAHQTVAERNVNLHMGVCVTCHREKNAPNECVTCHF